MEILPCEIIEIIGWMSWRNHGDIKSVIKFSMTSKTINGAIMCSNLAPLLQHMVMFKDVLININDILYYTTRPIVQYDGPRQVFSSIAHKNMIIYVNNNDKYEPDNDSLMWYNISINGFGNIIKYKYADGHNRILCTSVISKKLMNSNKSNEYYELFCRRYDRVINSCNCNMIDCIFCCI